MGEAERDFARRSVDAFNARDVDALVELTHPDCVLRGLRYEVDGTQYEGLSGIREFWADTADVWEDMKMTEPEIVDAEGRFLVTCALILQGRGSGAVVEHDFAWLVELRDGRMYRGRTTLDVEGARREFEGAA